MCETQFYNKLLENKNAIITGSNRGIGKAILTEMAACGANVWAHARRESPEFITECEELSKKYGVSIQPIIFDITDTKSMKESIKNIIKNKLKIDILVNNIGMVGSVNTFAMTSIEEMKEVFDVNFFAQMELTQYVSRVMSRYKSGSIINISACAGMDGNTGMLQYVSSKAAMIGATKRLAIELGEQGIRVNSIAPGLTETDMSGLMSEELTEKTLSHLVIKRKAHPLEIAKSVVFLASDMSSYITGQVIRVDGGMLN